MAKRKDIKNRKQCECNSQVLVKHNLGFSRPFLNRKGQEEIVGFVLIMLLVAVIILIILGIYLRREGTTEKKESREIYQFLGSMMLYTTDCAKSKAEFFDVKGLMLECYSKPDMTCSSGENVCFALNKTVTNLIDASFKLKAGSYIRGYYFQANYSSGARQESIFHAWRIVGTEKFIGAKTSADVKNWCANGNLAGGIYPSYEITSYLDLCYEATP